MCPEPEMIDDSSWSGLLLIDGKLPAINHQGGQTTNWLYWKHTILCSIFPGGLWAGWEFKPKNGPIIKVNILRSESGSRAFACLILSRFGGLTTLRVSPWSGSSPCCASVFPSGFSPRQCSAVHCAVQCRWKLSVKCGRTVENCLSSLTRALQGRSFSPPTPCTSHPLCWSL